MTNSIDGQILVWELMSGEFQRIDPARVKDIEWNNKSCIFSWDTIGAWLPEMRESDMNSISVSHDKSYMAIADNLGRPRIFNYPAYMLKQAYSVLEGHTSNVISCAFTQDDSYLITLGENDCSLMVWAYKASRYE
jgi:WD40 repeat protein